MEMDLDKISNLPGHVIDQILSQLSIKEAVKTSILSSKWRFKWATLPHLVFDNQCFPVSSQDQTIVKNKLYLAVGTLPGRLPIPCVNLNFLSLRINFNDAEEVLTALCLLRSSPNLQELEILARPEELAAVAKFINFQEDDHSSFTFNQLQLVKIFGISGTQRELNFINLVLLTSPVLERMTVKPASIDGSWELVKELLRFRRASTIAEVIYLDP